MILYPVLKLSNTDYASHIAPPHCTDNVPLHSSSPYAPYPEIPPYVKEILARCRVYDKIVFIRSSHMRQAQSLFISAKNRLYTVEGMSQTLLNNIREFDPDYSNFLAGSYPDIPSDLDDQMDIDSKDAPVDGKGKHPARS